MTEREALESTYFDRCTTYRRSDIKNPETKQQEQIENIVLEEFPCALSQDKGGELSLNGQRGKAVGSYTLFCSPEADIRKGDKVAVTTKAGQEITLWAGRAFRYADSHSEIPLSEDE